MYQVTFTDWDKFSGLALPNNWYALSFVKDLSVDSLSMLKFKFILIYNFIYFDFWTVTFEFDSHKMCYQPNKNNVNHKNNK
jgi:hypothetical protein